MISRTFNQHLDLLAEIFRRLREAHLRLNLDKCRFCVGQLKYLGHVVDSAGIHIDPEKISAVANCGTAFCKTSQTVPGWHFSTADS